MNPWMRLCAMLLLLMSAPLHAQTPAADEAEADAITNQVAIAFWWGDFATLTQLHDRYSQPDQLLDGWPRLAAFRAGIERVLDAPGKNVDAYFNQVQALTLAWAREHPRSGLAHALHAQALTSHAWEIRGSGYSDTVTPQAWAEFRRLMGQAQKYLADNAAAARASTLTHSTLLMLARVDTWPDAQMWAVIEDGTRRQPQDYVLYREGLAGVLPKWGGDAAAVDRYIRRVVDRTKADMGLTMYARLYSVAAREQFEHRLFEESRARWEDLDRGWRDLQRRHPSIGNLNRHAYFACLARDKAVLLELLEGIGDTPIADDWGRNGSRTFDSCKRWARAS